MSIKFKPFTFNDDRITIASDVEWEAVKELSIKRGKDIERAMKIPFCTVREMDCRIPVKIDCDPFVDWILPGWSDGRCFEEDCRRRDCLTQLFRLIKETPNLIWCVATDYPGRALGSWYSTEGCAIPLKNIHLTVPDFTKTELKEQLRFLVGELIYVFIR